MKPLPRLTRAIRAFTGLSKPDGVQPASAEEIISEYRQKKKLQDKQKKVSYETLKKELAKYLPSKQVSADLQNLRNLVKQLIGEETNLELVDDATVSLFFYFIGKWHVGPSDVSFLKQTYGAIDLLQANAIYRAVQSLLSGIPSEIQSSLKNLTAEDGPQAKFEFGKGLAFNFPNDVTSSDDHELVDWTQIEKNHKAKTPTLSFAYNELPAQEKDKPNEKPKKSAFDRSWLHRELQTYNDKNDSAPVPVEEFVESIVTLVCSQKTDDELQNEFFELLGFDRFELIQQLLEHREDIIKAEKSYTAKALVNSRPAKQVTQGSGPVIAGQVLIQSEQEKFLRKQVRKEEKRMQKARTDEEMEEITSSHAAVEHALSSVSGLPLLRRSAGTTVERYPNVYDSLAEAKHSSAMVGGMKMALPSSMERVNNSKYEEISIPATEQSPSEVGKNRIKISSLDEVGQLAFKGCKTLNQIQTVVFEAAYKTNENLLICAPTGAGKTNIAMLTVVHQIKQFIENGVLKKDQFKIVYVAPMKALAAEMTENFGKRLAPLGLVVKELTGDMQLTKTEIMQTQMLVTTPEKWDVITRKSTGDAALSQLVKLLIIDEVHLLHGDRGPVVEALVARTLRLVETSQNMIRIVGLSATLPNYIDVARFLRVNPYVGLFYFDSRFRPVPLSTCFIGVKEVNPLRQMQEMDAVCYDKVVSMVEKGHQVMVFVHARNATVRTAQSLREAALNKQQLTLFRAEENPAFGQAAKVVAKSRNKQMVELFNDGFSIHHAGMLRSDRNLVEKYFSEGLIKVLVCTATLAWGVNLPAHAVIIKGTEIYDAKHGSFVDLGILDVLQIFGRAGRPQFDKSGHGTIITSHDKLSHYLSLLTCQYPIESSFEASMIDNLNAEISLGSVTNVDEAVEWLSYSYLFIRMRKNPVAYGIRFDDLYNDPQLMAKRKNLIETAAHALDKAQMIRFDLRTGLLHPTDLGRTASDFYIKYATVEVFNEKLRDVMNDAEIFALISEAQEFDQIKVRDDELDELDDHKHGDCELPVKGGSENTHGKVNILLQTYISRGRVNSFSLVSDQSYIVQNATRIARALFEIVLRRNWALMAGRVLRVAKMMEQKLWDSQHPLNQFPTMGFDILQKIESKRLNLDKLREMDSKEIGYLINNQRAGPIVKRNAMEFPLLAIDASVQPITRTVLRVRLTITANYRWNDKVHGSSSEPFWVWVENPEDNHMYHYEFFSLTKKQVMKNEEQTVVFTIPIFEPLPSQYYVRVVSDRWLGCDFTHPMSFQHLILPERHPPHTDLLDLQPLPVTALNDSRLELLYPFTHFNPIQTQLFHILYHTDHNVLLGAPTGSGKTIVAEIAMFRVFRESPKSKVVYIAPLKALVRERIDDWKERLERKLNFKVVELTGDVTPDVRAIAQADVIVTTPEKWDGVSRSWQTRDYVRSVALIIIDEIHLLGEDRGPVLEVIVSRTNFIANHTGRTLRLIGLSTAVANARDLADWLNIGSVGLFNFRPSVRPVPLEVHISGFPGKHYCPRMATMNKPTYQAIKQHSPDKPVLVFVSSRRQTRLTALDLIGLLAVEENPRQFVRLAEEEMEQITAGVKDPNLKLTLSFGIGLHHAGLTDKDRRLVEELFVNQKIQVLIATATLAWGVNFPAHLVVIKGTEYYDGKTRRYVDMPITDVLQMMGRAGRPQFDDQGVAVVLVHDIKKHFYKKFLYEPFPVESSLLNVLPDHLNAEIVAGTIGSKQDALDYLTWTYFFRRLLQNPTYYDLDDVDPTNVNRYLSSLIDTALGSLSRASCIDIEEDNRTLQPTTLGRIASYYYLSFNTLQLFRDRLGPDCSLEDLLSILSDCTEYGELPVRHNEDLMNTELAKSCPISVNPYTMDSSHTKAHLLFQAHFSRLHLPVADYYTDTKSVLDQALRILQAMIDVSADAGWLSTTLRIQHLMQMVVQGVWVHDPSIMILPHVDRHMLPSLTSRTAEDVLHLPLFIERFGGRYEDLASRLRDDLDEHQIQQIHTTLQKLPLISISVSVNSVKGSVPVQMVDSSSYKDIQWVPVAAGMDCVITVTLSCDSPQQGTQAQAGAATGGARPKQLRAAENAPPQKGPGKSNYAYAPRFPKPKDEGWFLIAGSVETKELLALKRVSMGRSKSVHQMTIPAPTLSERFIVTLYLVSDCYPGMDQQYNVHLEACNQNSLPVLSADEYE